MRLEVGLEHLHLLGGQRLLAAEREHQAADQHGEQDDRDAVIALLAAEHLGDRFGHPVDHVQRRAR